MTGYNGVMPRALVIHESGSALDSIGKALRMEGFFVREARNTDHAIEMLDREGYRPHVVVSGECIDGRTTTSAYDLSEAAMEGMFSEQNRYVPFVILGTHWVNPDRAARARIAGYVCGSSGLGKLASYAEAIPLHEVVEVAKGLAEEKIDRNRRSSFK